MKKFISALSSFVIAATALGGSLAMSTTAATNGNVDATVIDIRSGDSNKVEGAKAGDSIPFKVYIPQSNGFNQLSLKLTVNGDETKGQDPSLCGGATSYTLTKSSKLGSAGETITHPELFGNYGIKMEGAKFSDPLPIDSKYYKPNDYWKAGKWSALGQTGFSTEYWNILATASGALGAEVNVDSYAAAEAAGLDRNADEDAGDPIFDYTKYTPVTTWTSDEAWAYKYSLVEGNFVLPDNIPDGTYVIDVFKGEYVNANFLEDFKADGTLPTAESDVSDTNGPVAFKSTGLTIVVGEGGQSSSTTSTTTTSTTTSTSTTTTTSSSSETNPGDGLILDLVAAGKTNTLTGSNNVAEVEPGETVKVNFTVKNDAITSGMEFTFDLGGLSYVADTLKAGRAYEAEMELNDGTAGQLTFVMASSIEMTAKDNATIVTFSVTAPQSGEATIGLKDGARAIVAGFNQGETNPYTFHGLTLKVTEAQDTTTTTSSTSTTSTTTTTSSSITPVGDILWGDTNCDKTVTIADVVLLNKSLAKNATLSEQGAKNADCQNDGTLDTKDAAVIKGYLALVIDYEVLGQANAYDTLQGFYNAETGNYK
ncbi:MAG: dockerin type I repeat-containing protein [Oscillospiraceae bacterium]|nr:dockerin type I repeat-containing protein [Oscillospiraceae bacterium]